LFSPGGPINTKQLSRISFFFLPVFLGLIALTGCSGLATSSFPDTPPQVHPGAISGSVFGGHAPIVGSEVYVFQVGASGYDSAAINELTPADAQGTDATHGAYVLSDSSGSFNISNEYTCTAGEPVYLAAIGGTASTTASLIDITGSTVTHTGTRFTITFTGANSLAPNDTVSFSSGAFTTDSSYSGLNGTTQAVTAATGSTFTFSFTSATTIAGSATGFALQGGTQNPAIANLAVLGLCPGSSGEFANSLSFVYMNEVSTIAAANALAAFGSGPFNIGASSTNLTGIANAAQTAGQLYDINKGGVALTTTNYVGSGNGTVPQTTLDTLGNILAVCVDSANTANSATNPAITGASSVCTKLFENATSNGVPFADSRTGPFPTDIATAAFNIAHNPAGASADSATVMTNLFALQAAGTPPFTPDLDTKPNDFTIGIVFTGGGIGITCGDSPHGVAVDASGNIYAINCDGDKWAKFSPLGVPANSTGFGTGLDGPDSLAIDSTSSFVWMTNFNQKNAIVNRFTTAGADQASFPLPDASVMQDAELDGSGNVWVTVNTPSELVKLNGNGTILDTIRAGLDEPFSVSIEPGTAGNVWVANGSDNDASAYTNAGATNRNSPYDTGGINDSIGNAIDSSGNIWFGNNNGTVTALTSAGVKVAGSPFETGNRNASDAVTIDGLNNVWITNTDGESIYELSRTGAEITPTAGYTTKPATEADGIAIDGSGNVWYDSFNGEVLYELVGAAAPVVTPLSLAVEKGQLGTRP
jgi:hypothetical protein